MLLNDTSGASSVIRQFDELTGVAVVFVGHEGLLPRQAWDARHRGQHGREGQLCH